jgi:rare lipoprotein A
VGAAYRFLQLGAYASEIAANQLAEEIREQWDYPVMVTAVDTEGARLHRVRVGPFSSADELERARARLIAADYPTPQRLP